MKKKLNHGFMLIETLIVTTFVSGILLFLFLQFISLGKNYDDSYKYNTVENLYAIRNVIDYLKSEENTMNNINSLVEKNGYLDITNCEIFVEKNYCLKLFELEGIKTVLITNNFIDSELFSTYNDGFKKFVKRINGEGEQSLRIIVEFANSKYATLKIGDDDE